MGNFAIQASGLGKQYRIGGKSQNHKTYKTIQETLINTALSPVRALTSLGKPSAERSSANTFWALDDVSFEVCPGEVMGIIGRNGAGKSTLLKIFAQITEPTRGSVDIYGRVGSLLEVGTGFHPELTGRENVYLNGAILGMKRTEITRKFDEIVAFAEVEKFIDTAVKHYSSGMYLRLAFAVAAHLEPEILIIDEVLTVGDAAFQKKCLGKMDEVARSGRTVLFVSHQMNAVRKLCDRCVWLDSGKVRMVDSTIKVVSAYESTFSGSSHDQSARITNTSVPAQFLSWEITKPVPEEPHVVASFGEFSFKVKVEVNKPIENGHHGIALWDSDDQLMWAWSMDNLKLDAGIRELNYTFPMLPLRAGAYSWQVSLYDNKRMLDNWYCVPQLIIVTETLADLREQWTGVLNLPCDFKVN